MTAYSNLLAQRGFKENVSTNIDGEGDDARSWLYLVVLLLVGFGAFAAFTDFWKTSVSHSKIIEVQFVGEWGHGEYRECASLNLATTPLSCGEGVTTN